MKFYVGDKVRFIGKNSRDEEYIGFGCTGEVVDIDNHDGGVRCRWKNPKKELSNLEENERTCWWAFSNELELIESQENVESEWILCSEKNPKENELVILTFENEWGIHSGIAKFTSGKWLFEIVSDVGTFSCEYEKPIAWMEFPEPYNYTNKKHSCGTEELPRPTEEYIKTETR